MGSTLEHGIYLPSEGEKNCYSGLANNWQTVDTNIGYVTALRQAIAGALTRQIVTQLPTENINPNCIYMILKATAQTSNIYDEYMYINSNWELIGDSQLDLSNYYTKQEVNELPAVASGVTSTKVGNYDSHISDGDIHVTANDKAKWNTVALIKHLRLVNAQVGSATTIPFSDFDDTNGIKVGDKCADLDVKVFEITAVDTANQTVTVSPLLDIALDANVVHNAGDETVGGIKTFSDETYIKSLNFTNEVPSQSSSNSSIMPIITTITYGDSSPAVQARLNLRVTADGIKSLYPHENNQYYLGLTSRKWKEIHATAYYYGSSDTEFSDKFVTTDTTQTISGNKTFSGGTALNSWLYFTNTLVTKGTIPQSTVNPYRMYFGSGVNYANSLFNIDTSVTNTGAQFLTLRSAENVVNGDDTRFVIVYDPNLTQPRYVSLKGNFIPNANNTYECGTNNSKWKSINGLEPSALSMPDLDNGIDISSYIDITQTSQYTAPANGYISICGYASSTNTILLKDHDYDFGITARAMLAGQNTFTTYLIIPVVKNHVYDIICNAVTTLDYAKFYPCQGNV